MLTMYASDKYSSIIEHNQVAADRSHQQLKLPSTMTTHNIKPASKNHS